jgi:hypothetical protein
MKEDDDDKVLKVKINKAPIKTEMNNEPNRNKNITQEEVENPPMRETTATMITEYFFIGDEEIAYDPRFMKQNGIFHVLNLSGNNIANVFDPNMQREKLVIEKLSLLPPNI